MDKEEKEIKAQPEPVKPEGQRKLAQAKPIPVRTIRDNGPTVLVEWAVKDDWRRAYLPNELLHELIRIGEEAVSSGVEHLQLRMDRLVQASIDRIGPVRRAREEMGRLRQRLEELEASLAAIDVGRRSEDEPAEDREDAPSS
jgi:hypothetical protein